MAEHNCDFHHHTGIVSSPKDAWRRATLAARAGRSSETDNSSIQDDVVRFYGHVRPEAVEVKPNFQETSAKDGQR